MTDAEHPIDMLDEAPEGDAIEQQQTTSDAAPATGGSVDANPADAQEQGQGATSGSGGSE